MEQNVKPVLTIGMIVKNEIRCLERCLKAFEPLRKALPCELIIADTGSDDGTRKIAEKYADLVFDFPWINDFAAARNSVLDKAHGEWFLTVDADEYLDEDCEEQNRGCWWLRYYGDFHDREEGAYDFISCVNFDGYIEWAAQGVEETDCCVRPAFWLKTDCVLKDKGNAL